MMEEEHPEERRSFLLVPGRLCEGHWTFSALEILEILPEILAICGFTAYLRVVPWFDQPAWQVYIGYIL